MDIKQKTKKMKKSIIYLLALTFMALLYSCGVDDILILEEYGYVKTHAELYQNLTSKNEVPTCSDEIPEKISYIFRNESGETFIRESSVVNTYNSVWLNEEIRLPVGSYVVEDISLISDTGTVTHRVPNRETTAFDFSSFVDISTPFDIEIFALEETNIESYFLCYTSEILDTSGTLGSFNEILPLQTLYFKIPEGGCVDRVTVDIYYNENEQEFGKKIIDVDVSGRGIRGIPIVKDFEFMDVSAWSNGEKISFVTLTEYNQTPDADGGISLNFDDVVVFGNVCN